MEDAFQPAREIKRTAKASDFAKISQDNESSFKKLSIEATEPLRDADGNLMPSRMGGQTSNRTSNIVGTSLNNSVSQE